MKDRRPPGQQNPYEYMGRGGKMQRPREKEVRTCERAVDAVQGCGEVGCPICMPAGGRGAQGAASPASITASAAMMEEWQRRIAERLVLVPGEFNVSLDGMSLGTARLTAAGNQERERRTGLERAATAARQKVEKYLLRAEHSLAWDDVVGNQAAREALIEAVEAPIKHAALYAHYGARPPRGALLFGPPGCGKTMFAKAASAVLKQLHGGAGGEMLVVNGPQIQSPYVGVTEEIIRDIFAYARAYRALHGRPLVVFVDECDAILPCRDGSGTGRRALPWEESNVATFLTEMDGMEESGAFVLLATNRPDAIDPALLRDGRCDRRIRVERPGKAEARLIIWRALRSTPVHRGTDTLSFAAEVADHLFSADHCIGTVRHAGGVERLTLGAIASGASVTSLVGRMKGIAMRRDLAQGGTPSGITWADADAAIEEVLREARAMPVPILAVQELAERLGIVIEAVEPYRAPRAAFSPEEIEAIMREAA